MKEIMFYRNSLKVNIPDNYDHSFEYDTILVLFDNVKKDFLMKFLVELRNPRPLAVVMC